MSKTEEKRVALVVAFRDYQDKEYSATREILETSGMRVSVVSSSLGEARGIFLGKVKVDLLIREVKSGDFNAVVFIGGPGAEEYMDNPIAHDLARKMAEKNRVLGAICIAPEILAKSGVLRGKKATVWSSSSHQESINILRESGAEYVDTDIVIDNNIVTANGPIAAEQFGQALADLLGG